MVGRSHGAGQARGTGDGCSASTLLCRPTAGGSLRSRHAPRNVWAPEGMDHLRTVLRVETETLDADGNRTNIENRYFVASLPRSRLTDG